VAVFGFFATNVNYATKPDVFGNMSRNYSE